MKHKLKYLNLFESSLDDDYPDIFSQEARWFLSNKLSYSVVHETRDNLHVFSVSEDIDSKSLWYIPYKNPHKKDDEFDDNLEEGEDENAEIRISDLQETKWSDTLIGKFDSFVIENNGTVEIFIEKNPNLKSLDELIIIDNSGNGIINLYISDNPELEHLDISSESYAYYTGLIDNPKLWNLVLELNDNGNTNLNDFTIRRCPYIMLVRLFEIFGSLGNDYELMYFTYENNGIEFEEGDIFINDNDELKELALQEILNITDYSNPIFKKLIPTIIEYLLDNTQDVTRYINQIVNFGGLNNMLDVLNNNEILFKRLPINIQHLYHPDYKGTSVRDVAKFKAGQIYGIF